MKDLIKAIRFAANMNQEQFASALGTTPLSINRWENGKTLPNRMAQTQLYNFCKEHAIDVAQLIIDTKAYGDTDNIAGFPSLYLGTSLELCHEEVQHNPHEQLALASRFQLERNFEYNNTEIKVIELAIKPQDFFVERNRFDTYRNKRIIPEGVLKRVNVREAYLRWYPLIAACSFIRVNKKDPFAAEYIIPQLLMQWVRSEMGTPKQNYDRLVGIRYFSCASTRASDMGFNYVFPASGKHTKESFCPTLSRAFKLTKPYFLHEYRDIYACEDALRKDNNLDFI